MTEKEFSRYYRIPRARAAGNASSSPQSFEELVAAVTPPAHELARQQARARHTTRLARRSRFLVSMPQSCRCG